jgi:hypothetical protein
MPSHCKLHPAVIMKSVTSNTPSVRADRGGAEVELIVPVA